MARWLDFLAEYDCKIDYRLEKMNAPADRLPLLDLERSVMLGYSIGDLACTTASTKYFSGLEAHLVSTTTYLSEVSIDYSDSETRRRTRQNSKRTVVWSGNVFLRVRGSLRLILQKSGRCLILKSYHDGIGPRLKKAALTMPSDRFWRLSMYREVSGCVKTREDCQRMSFIL